jgi:hypothetical protein
MLTDLITSGAMHSLKSVFQKKKERNVIIDPFSCLVKLSLIRYLEEGTKVSIYQNRLNFNAPSYMQGIVRFMYGDNREDLHNILLPIQKCVEWYWNERNPDMVYMFNNAVLGLKFLKNSYSTYATIHHTLDYYIIILMQKNTAVMGRMGINTIDIERLTTALLESSSPTPTSTPTPTPTPTHTPIPTIEPISGVAQQHSIQQNTTQNKKDKRKESIPESKENKETREQLPEHDQGLGLKILQQRDIHKFLFELWNEREMGIVINLYREMETKHPGVESQNSIAGLGCSPSSASERNYIYNNIMQYCEMKENKLYKYIEQNSSVL